MTSIYSPAYAALYKSLYIDPWADKHGLNVFLVHRILAGTSSEFPRWLDVGCGPAWHFSRVPAPGVAKIGLDISWAQLSVARAHNPDASFVCADMTTAVFSSNRFGLITSFWSPYTYLDNISQIVEFVRRLADWAAPGGSIYMDLMLPKAVATFSGSSFARDTGFSLERLADDGTRWVYKDIGGNHEIVTPELSLFRDCLAAHFSEILVQHDRRGFAHLVAVGKRS